MIRTRYRRLKHLRHRAGFFAPPLRSLPAVQREYAGVCRVVAANAKRLERFIWSPWPGRLRRDDT